MSSPAQATSTPTPTRSARIQRIVTRLASLTSTLSGLEGGLMLVQYSSPVVITLLLALAKLRDNYPALLKRGGGDLRAIAEGWGRVGTSFGETRTIMRLVGLLPLIVPTIKTLYPDPVKSLLFSPLPTLQLISLLLYYPLEHISWLASKGVVQADPAKVGKWVKWSVRFWGIYVVAEYFKLHGTYANLQYRTKQLKRSIAASKPAISASEAEGYELQEKGGDEKDKKTTEVATTTAPVDAELLKRKEALRADWAAWKDSAVINAGYTPLLVNWALPTDLWANPLITAFFGTIVAGTKLSRSWRATA